jgi:hypothetical protein
LGRLTRPTTIAQYIRAAPRDGQPHLRRLYAILRRVAPTAARLRPFRRELQRHKTTKGMLQVPYADPLPEALIRKIAKYRVRVVREREDDSFW